MGQLDRTAPKSPCDFYASSQSGSVFNNQLANFEVQIPNGAKTTGFCTNVVIRWEAGSSCTIAMTRLMYMYFKSSTATVDQDSSFIRMEDNSGAGYGPYAYLELSHGNDPTKGPKYLIYSNPQKGLCCSHNGELSLAQSGWFRVNLGGGFDRYIALYSS